MPFIKYFIVAKPKQILFLNLYAFSLTGGVEKVSKNFIYALHSLFEQKAWESFSMHDNTDDVDTRYTPLANYQAFSGKKKSFVINSLWVGLRKQIIILSHINLLLVAKLISILSPKKRFILFAHGIEIWGKLSLWKIDFIRNNVEVWAVSTYTKQKLIDVHQLSPEKIKVLNNSLSPFSLLPHQFEKPNYLVERYNIDINKPILYTLTRLSAFERYKGYDTVISALGKLKQAKQKFTYLLAGKADESETQRIEQLIELHDLKEEVRLIGYISEEDLTAHFLLSNIFIMPSKGEGFGIVFIEAAAHGCQVIAGNVDGSTDALLNGELGQLINPNSEEEIINAIQKAINNTAHQPRAQQNLTVRHFGFERYVEKVKRLINIGDSQIR